MLNTLLNCFVKSTLSLVDKVTVGFTSNLACVILNFSEPPALDKMMSSIQMNFLIDQLHFY